MKYTGPNPFQITRKVFYAVTDKLAARLLSQEERCVRRKTDVQTLLHRMDIRLSELEAEYESAFLASAEFLASHQPLPVSLRSPTGELRESGDDRHETSK